MKNEWLGLHLGQRLRQVAPITQRLAELLDYSRKRDLNAFRKPLNIAQIDLGVKGPAKLK